MLHHSIKSDSIVSCILRSLVHREGFFRKFFLSGSYFFSEPLQNEVRLVTDPVYPVDRVLVRRIFGNITRAGMICTTFLGLA